VAWQENNPGPFGDNNKYTASINYNYRNYDIYMKKSVDGGLTFSKEINLSNNPGYSEHPHIAVSGNNVYVVWIDDTSSISTTTVTTKNKEILFRKSITDRRSISGQKNYPKVAAFENSTYVVWNVGIIGDTNNNNISNGIFFMKSLDSGNSFSDTIKLNSNSNSIGESQIAAYGNNVYVVWGGNPDDKIVGNMFFVKSSDNGNRFSNAISITEKNSLNVEVIADRNNNVYIVWQGVLSDRNEEILLKKSSDDGASFTNTNENISKNEGISECTSIAVSENNNVYIAWEDDTFGNHEILFAKNI
jgi:hypothetical protein